MYPVGSVYMTETNIDPNDSFYGTWELWEAGRMPLAAGNGYAVGSIGGEAEHTLTVDEMPSHSHGFVRQQWFTVDTVVSSSSGSIFSWKTSTGGATSASYRGSPTEHSGGSQPHNNLPPYKAIYIWERIL